MKDTGQPMRSAAPLWSWEWWTKKGRPLGVSIAWPKAPVAAHPGDDAPAPVRGQAGVSLRLEVLGGEAGSPCGLSTGPSGEERQGTDDEIVPDSSGAGAVQEVVVHPDRAQGLVGDHGGQGVVRADLDNLRLEQVEGLTCAVVDVSGAAGRVTGASFVNDAPAKRESFRTVCVHFHNLMFCLFCFSRSGTVAAHFKRGYSRGRSCYSGSSRMDCPVLLHHMDGPEKILRFALATHYQVSYVCRVLV